MRTLRLLFAICLLLPLLALAQYTGGQGRGDVMVGFLPPALPTVDCPLLGANIGDPCDDGDADTENDAVSADCVCAGTPIGGPCTTDMLFAYAMGTNPDVVTWSVYNAVNDQLVESGTTLGNAGSIGGWCLPDGCYYLRVTDSGGDGMNGGYVLRTLDDRRLIDNTDNFNAGGLSAIAGNEGFCLPLGTDRAILSNCDKLWWREGEYLVATENTAVSATWVNGPNSAQSAVSGYEFWWYDPNGGYSFRKFRPHNESDGYANVGATRACHIKLNNWASANQLPQGKLLNVKVRGVVNGVPFHWGVACRFKLDPVAAACPPTKLLDRPDDARSSCDRVRDVATSERHIYATPVRGATAYEWSFSNGEIGTRGFTTANYILNLMGPQMRAANIPVGGGQTYEVRVRARVGNDWCDFGDVCLLTTTSSRMTGPNEQSITDGGSGLSIWPNPNRGDQLWLSIGTLDENVETVTVDLYDLSGKRILARVLLTQGGQLGSVFELNGDLASGTYLLRIVAGDNVYTERLVVQP